MKMHYLLSLFLFLGTFNSTAFTSANNDMFQSIVSDHDDDSDSSLKTIRVLSIQGGGIRGIIPAKILQAAEELLQDSTMNHFDVFAGTSTGSLISLGLVTPDEGLKQPLYKAEDIVNIYRNHGGSIFSRSASGKFLNPYAICKPKYSPDNLKDILKAYFKETPLSSALKTVLVTSYDVQNSLPVTFNSYKTQQSDEFDFSIRKIARASSAAPAFFPPAHLKQRDNTKISLSDGCIWALTLPKLLTEKQKWGL